MVSNQQPFSFGGPPLVFSHPISNPWQPHTEEQKKQKFEITIDKDAPCSMKIQISRIVYDDVRDAYDAYKTLIEAYTLGEVGNERVKYTFALTQQGYSNPMLTKEKTFN